MFNSLKHKITISEFNKKVEARSYFIQNNLESCTVKDAIEMTRLFNTIRRSDTLKSSLHKTYTNLFFYEGHAIRVVAKIIETYPEKGMIDYSKKYNLYIGGYPHKNSVYYIKN